jgi:hypothetical protein
VNDRGSNSLVRDAEIAELGLFQNMSRHCIGPRSVTL